MIQPYYDHNGIIIYHGRCEDILPAIVLPPHVVITDPDYGTGGWRRLESGAGSNPAAALVQEDWDQGGTDWLRLLTTDVVFTFWPSCFALPLLATAVDVGLVKHRTLYMRKRDPKPQVAGRTRWSVEPIWVLSHTGFVLLGGDDVYEASTPRSGRDKDATGHPYQKPLGVMQWLISKTTHPLIVDPKMGSGTTLDAACIMGRAAIGIEQDEQWCEVAAHRLARRLQQEVLPLGEVA
jgi:site-specific DNA-methyltransferase (adenine-specific)